MKYMLATSVFVTFEFVGFHRWPEAPAEVDYLRARHRHLFKARVYIDVGEENRQIEYHMLKRELTGVFFPDRELVVGTDEVEFGDWSCEKIAHVLLEAVQILHPDRPYYLVEVSEDGENGSIIEAVAVISGGTDDS